jgi:hypothetical protein
MHIFIENVRVAGVGYVTRESLASERTVAVVNGS